MNDKQKLAIKVMSAFLIGAFMGYWINGGNHVRVSIDQSGTEVQEIEQATDGCCIITNTDKHVFADSKEIDTKPYRKPSVLQSPYSASMDDLIKAVEKVESNCNVDAVGDNGNAVGCLQIWKICIDDCNRIQKKVKYTYKDRKSRKKSYEMFKIYVNHYATKKRLKRTPTDEDRARIWVAGPNGYKKDCSKAYWAKVSKQLFTDKVKAKLKGK